jgi:hypothetical protein
LDARNPSRIARRKGDPLLGVSTGLASVVIATTKAIPALNSAHIFIGSGLSRLRVVLCLDNTVRLTSN